MKLFIAAIILVTVRADLGTDKCTWGPSYWCSSIKAASSCQSFKHCLESVWKPRLVHVQQTDECLSGQKVIEEARRIPFTDGKEQTPFMTSICNLLPDEEELQKCQETVSEFLPQVLMLVQSGAESSSVASLLGLCKPSTNEEETEEEVPETDDVNTSLCDGCHTFINRLSVAFGQAGTQEQFANTLVNDVCSKLGDLNIWCKAVVEKAVPKVVKHISDFGQADEVCSLGTFCMGPGRQKPKFEWWYDAIKEKLSDIISDIEMDTDKEVICHDCEKVLHSVLAFEKDSSFTKSLQQIILHLCLQLNLDEKQCSIFSVGLIPAPLFDMALRDLNLTQVCRTTLGCTGEDAQPLTVSTTLPAVQKQVFEPTPEYCSNCLQFFGDISEGLRAVSVEKATETAKRIVCDQVDGLYECKQLIDTFLPLILGWMAQPEGPQAICSAHFALCPKSKGLPKFDLVKAFDAAYETGPLYDIKCDICMQLVDQVRAEDRNPDIQNSIISIFNSVCDQLGSAATQCKTLVQQFAPEFFELIATELDPTSACGLLLHCTKPELQEQYEENIPNPERETAEIEQEPSEDHDIAKRSVENQLAAAPMECDVCHLAMETINNMIAENKTEDSFESYIDKLCDILPSIKEPCEQFVATFTPIIIDLLLQEFDPLLICDELQLCNQTEPQFSYQTPELGAKKILLKREVQEEFNGKDTTDYEEEELPGASIECQLCQLVIGSVDKIIGENRSEAAIQKALDDICNILPQGIRSECLSFVNEYAAVVIQLLQQELQPDQVCAFLKLCNQTQGELGAKKVLLKRGAQEEFNGKDTTNYEEEELPGASIECQLCQLVIGSVDKIIGENRSEAAIQKALDDICNILPQGIRSQCLSFVNEYAAVVVQLLQQELQPDQVCAFLKLCNQTQGAEAPEPTEATSVAGPQCSLCELVVSQLDDLLANDKTEAAVESALDKVCSLLPNTISAECQSYVQTYGPSVINLLIAELSPQEVCKTLGLCTVSERVMVDLPEARSEPEDTDTSLECKLCGFIFAEINRMTANDKSQESIMYAVSVVCDALPGNMKLRCQSEVKNYGPEVLDLLHQTDDPNSICQAAKRCTQFSSNASSNKKMFSVSNEDVCIICQTLVNFAQEALAEQSTTEGVENVLRDVCAELPGSLSSSCDTIVEQFTPLILQYLENEIDPHQICQELKLCSSDVETPEQ